MDDKPGPRANIWAAVTVIGIVAFTAVACGWGAVLFLLNK